MKFLLLITIMFSDLPVAKFKVPVRYDTIAGCIEAGRLLEGTTSPGFIGIFQCAKELDA